jgi:ABC-type amino acid transport substrate-binding protein
MRPIDMSDKNTRIAARLGSPQHTDYASEGFPHITATYAYEDLAKLLARSLVDVAIVPRSVYNEQKADWPPKVLVSAGKLRSSGFYLNKDDPKGLLKPLNESIARCRDIEASK